MRLTFEWRNKIISVIHKSKLDFPYSLKAHHTVVFVCDMNFKNPLMASRSLQKLIKNGRLLQTWCLAWLLSVAAKPSHMVKMAVVAAESKACHVLLLLNRLRCQNLLCTYNCSKFGIFKTRNGCILCHRIIGQLSDWLQDRNSFAEFKSTSKTEDFNWSIMTRSFHPRWD